MPTQTNYDAYSYLTSGRIRSVKHWGKLQDYMISDDPDPEEKLLMKERIHILMECLEKLEPRYACIIIGRFGLGGEPPMTLQKLSKRLRYKSASGVYGALIRATEALGTILVERRILSKAVDPHDVIHMFVGSCGGTNTELKPRKNQDRKPTS